MEAGYGRGFDPSWRTKGWTTSARGIVLRWNSMMCIAFALFPISELFVQSRQRRWSSWSRPTARKPRKGRGQGLWRGRQAGYGRGFDPSWRTKGWTTSARGIVLRGNSMMCTFPDFRAVCSVAAETLVVVVEANSSEAAKRTGPRTMEGQAGGVRQRIRPKLEDQRVDNESPGDCIEGE